MGYQGTAWVGGRTGDIPLPWGCTAPHQGLVAMAQPGLAELKPPCRDLCRLQPFLRLPLSGFPCASEAHLGYIDLFGK